MPYKDKNKQKEYQKRYQKRYREEHNIKDNRYKENKEYWRKYHKKYREEHKEKINKIAKEYRTRNPEKSRYNARKSYYKNRDKILKNQLIKQKLRYNNNPVYRNKKIVRAKTSKNIKIPKKKLCEICNINIAKEKHHEDYNKPLEIKFLCRDCHLKLHGLKKY